MAQAASRDGGGELERLQWAAPTGTDTFAVPKDHKDLMRHLRVVMLRGVPETALAVDDRTKTSSNPQRHRQLGQTADESG